VSRRLTGPEARQLMTIFLSRDEAFADVLESKTERAYAGAEDEQRICEYMAKCMKILNFEDFAEESEVKVVVEN
jgi:hypothetical protein